MSAPIYNHLSALSDFKYMVKTRNNSNTLPSQKPPKSKPSKSRQSQVQMNAISNKQLRSRLKAKISKARKQEIVRKEKKIEITNEQLARILTPQKFHCPICLQIMIFPTISQCGHTFCLPCIEESLKHKHNCSLCRDNLTFQQFKHSSLISEILQMVITRSLSQAEMEQYNKRKKEWEEKDRQHRVTSDVKVGDKVDFYIDDAWQSGKVIEREEDQQNCITLNVQAQDNQDLSRKLTLQSRLLAKQYTYTKEKTPIHELFGIGRFRLQVPGNFLREIGIAMPTSQIQAYPVSLRTANLPPNGQFVRIVLTFRQEQ